MLRGQMVERVRFTYAWLELLKKKKRIKTLNELLDEKYTKYIE